MAAYVASGMADVGFGLETPARQFKLDFVPLASERYFLLCRTALLATPMLQQVLQARQALRDPAFAQDLAALPGYDGINAGRTLQLQDAFPALGGAQ